MNFLAHLYLSPNNSFIKTGNFIADWVKGKAYENYPTKIQQGILLHRSIDYFTDTHEIVSESKLYFRETYGKYAGVITDIVYDHFLAKNWLSYKNESLQDFSNNTFKDLYLHIDLLPLGVKSFLPKMQASNRLVSYSSLESIANVLEIMSNHTSLPNHTLEAIRIIEDNYTNLQNEFTAFMPRIEAHLRDKYKGIF